MIHLSNTRLIGNDRERSIGSVRIAAQNADIVIAYQHLT